MRKMKKIEFLIGYYEYNIFIDNEFIYSFGDFDEYFEDIEQNTRAHLDGVIEYVVSDCIELLIESAKNTFENNFTERQKKLILSLNEKEIKELKKQMFNVLKNKYE